MWISSVVGKGESGRRESTRPATISVDGDHGHLSTASAALSGSGAVPRRPAPSVADVGRRRLASTRVDGFRHVRPPHFASCAAAAAAATS